MGAEEGQKAVQSILLRCQNGAGRKKRSVARKREHKLGTSQEVHLGHLPLGFHFSLNDSYPGSLDLQTIFLG